MGKQSYGKLDVDAYLLTDFWPFEFAEEVLAIAQDNGQQDGAMGTASSYAKVLQQHEGTEAENSKHKHVHTNKSMIKNTDNNM